MLTEVKGLVIRTVDIKESDKLITIFTEEMGVVTAMAKGARSLRSRHLAATSLFCYSTFVLYSKGDNFWIRESELHESFFGIRKTVEGLALAGYILEVICHAAVSAPDRELLRLSLNSLYAISSAKYSLSHIKAAFEIRCASVLGFMPDLLACRECGERLGDFFFDIMSASLVCYSCHKKAEGSLIEENPHERRVVTILSEGAKIALGYATHAPLEKLFSFKISDEDMHLFGIAAESYLLNHLERSFKSLDFYNSLK